MGIELEHSGNNADSAKLSLELEVGLEKFIPSKG